VNKLNTFLSNALTKTKAILSGVTLTYEGDSVEGIYNTQSQEAELIPGGLNNQYETTFLINNVDIAAAGIAFVKGKKATLQSREWKIDRLDVGEVTTLLYLVGWNESAVSN
jgi:hypothetical protein